jgi:hypothetical protein
MVRSYLIENRICYEGDGNGGGGGGGNDQEPDRSFGEQRLAGGTTNLIDTSRRANPAVELSDEDFDETLQQDIAAASAARSGVDMSNYDDSNFNYGPDFATAARATNLVNQAADPLAMQQQLAQSPTLQNAMVNLSGGVAPTAAPSRQEQSAFRREMVRNLLENSVQDSLADPNRPGPVTPTRAPGRNDPQSGYYSDIYRELYGGTPPGTGMATIFGGGPLGSLFNTPNPADAQAFNIGQLQRMVEQTRTGTIDPNTGAVTGVQAGPGTLSMNSLGGIVYSGRNDPNYEGPFANLVRGTAGQNMSGGDDGGSSQPASQPPAPATVDPGTTPPEVIDDLAVNYLRDPFYLYSGQSNLFQPYGYAGGTLVDLLQTRRMTQPQQAAANLNLFGNPRDFM